MNILDGKAVAEAMHSKTKRALRLLGMCPGLGVVLVGDDAASHLYVSLKERMAEQLGIRVEKRFLFENATQQDVENVIRSFNEDGNIHGILVQLPLPLHINADDVIQTIDPAKDVDGFHPENERRFLAGEMAFPPVFPCAILSLIRASGEMLPGKNAVVVGNSWRFRNIMSLVLKREGVSAKHIPCVECVSEQGLSELKRADIVVSACGKERTLTGSLLKAGAIVIDGGIVKDGAHIIGDVDRASVRDLDGFLSPVPGGVGPVTIACLLSNVAEAARRQGFGNE